MRSREFKVESGGRILATKSYCVYGCTPRLGGDIVRGDGIYGVDGGAAVRH